MSSSREAHELWTEDNASLPATGDLPTTEMGKPDSNDDQGESNGPLFVLETFFPVFVSSWELETGICSICRNQVEGPCVNCQCDAETTAWECTMMWGKCGHAFHTHCIQRWLKTRQVCPLDNRPWVDKKEWNKSV
ncbi:unnamed protein product [Phytomonas sp. EM1]|nr:unnamed protein product [Phytomonas sp. EM1]|eukprot:CCW62566.1 unnamed protein product [Phytomonas sp. isolate EM1]